MLDRPAVRLALGAAGVVVTAATLDRERVGPTEERCFRLVNELPDPLFPPTWVVMQAGALGAVPVAAGVAYLADERRVAGHILTGGASAWALSKVVKRVVQRPRPGALIRDSRRRGAEATGLGYLSGHAAVAVAMMLAAWPRLGRRARAASLLAVPIVGLSRIYVGAHLPLDVVGGASLGLAINAVGCMCDRKSGGSCR